MIYRFTSEHSRGISEYDLQPSEHSISEYDLQPSVGEFQNLIYSHQSIEGEFQNLIYSHQSIAFTESLGGDFRI